MDEVLNEQIGNISELSSEELSALKEDIQSRFNELNEQETRTRESVDSMMELATAMQSVKNENIRREEESKELEALAQQASELINQEEEEEVVEEIPAEESAEEVVEEAAEEQDTPVNDEDDENEEILKEEELEDEVVKDFSDDTPEEDSEVENEDVESDTDSADTLSQENPEENSELSTSDQEDDEAESVEDEADLSTETSNTESEPDMANVNTEFSAPDENTPSGKVEQKTATIVAAADLRGIQSGSVIPGFRELASAILERRTAMGRTSGGDGEQALVASIKTDDFYDADRTLLSSDTEGNQAKVNAVVASVAQRTSETDSLVAAGGLYGPVETSYDIYKLGESLARPVKAALPSFKADRGGLRFLTPPVLADLQGAVSVWTLEDDVLAADPTSGKEKPCIRIKAGEEVTVYIEALPLCLTFGNIGARAFPEMVERHIELAMVWQARFAESRLLERIGRVSTKVTAKSELGVARDILGQIDRAGAALRNRHRLEPNFPLKAIFPLWFKDAMRSDLVKQMPGDGQETAFSLADATIDRWFSERNVSVTWTYDGESTQYFAEQADGALVNYPSKVVWYLFPEGTFLFLEDATLDLGIVRDSTLNATNDYKMFVETFENVAKVGVESLRVESDVTIAGAVAGTVATTVVTGAATSTPVAPATA